MIERQLDTRLSAQAPLKKYARPWFGVDPDFYCFSVARIEDKKNAGHQQDKHDDDDNHYQHWRQWGITEIKQVTA